MKFVRRRKDSVAFNSFINSGGLVEVPSGGYTFTWALKSAAKMSKLDRFLISEDLMRACPHISSITLDRFLSDHRPILLRELNLEYGPTPFRFFHNWFDLEGFNSFILKGQIRLWVKDKKDKANIVKKNLKKKIGRTSIVIWIKGGVAPVIWSRWLLSTLTSRIGERKEEIDLAQKDKDKNGRIVDFEKAFDSVRWDFLDDILEKFGFGMRWRDWIQSCLKSSRGSILVNGIPTSEFQFHKGLKQGDPLSPLLFILVMESLHLSFLNVVSAGLFKGISLNSSLQIFHFFYADDVIFIGKLIGIAVDSVVVEAASKAIGCLAIKLPFSYLGISIGGYMSRLKAWEDVINKVVCRLSKWKMKSLSIGGRLTLLKYVLGSTPIYYLSMYKAPIQVLKKLESIRSHFFNGANLNVQKMSFIKWEKVLASKDKGGLGVAS
ncbi:RNA-directed DNA polymerase, eukaryota, partial [Tanacetum coccineum]